MPRAASYGTIQEVTKDGTLELAETSVVLPPEPEFMRWFALGQFCLLTFGTAASVGAHTVIVNPFRKYFDLTVAQVDFLNTVFLGSYLLFGAAIMKIFTRFGLKGGMYCASTLFLVGAGLKVVSVYVPEHYYLILVAQLFLAIAINFVMAGPSLLSATWFPQSERTFATTVASQADNIGIAFALFFPSAIVKHRHSSRDEMLIVFGVLFVLACVDSFLTFCVVPKEPKVPLRVAASGEEIDATSDKSIGLATMFKSVAHSRSYLVLAVAAGLAIAFYWTYSAIYAQILLPFGISEKQSGILGSVKILFGVVPAMLIAKRVDRTRSYKEPLRVAMVVCVVCVTLIIAALNKMEDPWQAVFLLHLPMGVAQSVIMPIALEYMVELTFPVDPSVSAGVFMYCLRVFCTVTIMLTPLLLPARATIEQANVVMFGYTAMSVLAVLALSFVGGKLRRLTAERGNSPATESSSLVAPKTTFN
jgi:FLVCR family MFS transporter 7